MDWQARKYRPSGNGSRGAPKCDFLARAARCASGGGGIPPCILRMVCALLGKYYADYNGKIQG